ncbi:uncharacterized protein LOC106645202 [Copidosoma floridanum]|uniref:uncharacterized protein LOC106645202 n=1 Tax=Copidosoma floridanum TaxID=29053 RepID=UPI0006C95435|nr:uncharacterized protein LOC106645202 [Copidosoma floridanum]
MGFEEATSGCVVSLNCAGKDQLIPLLKRFWEIEELPADPNSLWTGDERACEQHFIDTRYRDSTGRYVVRLPFKTDPKRLVKERDAAETLSITMQTNLERRFQNNSVLFDAYSLFMREYIDPNHMVELKLDETNDCWFLPHHGVINLASTTTKLRTVFNGSAKFKAGISLNDLLHVGPNLLCNLFDLITSWRSDKFVFSSDIEKMFRQACVDEIDQKHQCIFWRFSSLEPVLAYQLKTVTNRLACSPYLACRVIKQLASDY